MCGKSELANDFPALPQRVDVAVHVPQRLKLGAAWRHQLKVDW
jgi:hypothetical protein